MTGKVCQQQRWEGALLHCIASSSFLLLGLASLLSPHPASSCPTPTAHFMLILSMAVPVFRAALGNLPPPVLYTLEAFQLQAARAPLSHFL